MPSSFPSSRLPSIKAKTQAAATAGGDDDSVLEGDVDHDEEVEEIQDDDDDIANDNDNSTSHHHHPTDNNEDDGEEAEEKKKSDEKQQHSVPNGARSSSSNNREDANEKTPESKSEGKMEVSDEKKGDRESQLSEEDTHARAGPTVAASGSSNTPTSPVITTGGKAPKSESSGKSGGGGGKGEKRSLFSIFAPHHSKKRDSATLPHAVAIAPSSSPHQGVEEAPVASSPLVGTSSSRSTQVTAIVKPSSRGGSHIEKRSHGGGSEQDDEPTTTRPVTTSFDKEAAERAFDAWAQGIDNTEHHPTSSSTSTSSSKKEKKQKFGSVRRRFTLTGTSGSPVAASSLVGSPSSSKDVSKGKRGSVVVTSSTIPASSPVVFSDTSDTLYSPISPSNSGTRISQIHLLEKEKEELKAELDKAYTERDQWREKYNQSLQIVFELQEKLEEYEKRELNRRQRNKQRKDGKGSTASGSSRSPMPSTVQQQQQQEQEQEQQQEAQLSSPLPSSSSTDHIPTTQSALVEQTSSELSVETIQIAETMEAKSKDPEEVQEEPNSKERTEEHIQPLNSRTLVEEKDTHHSDTDQHSIEQPVNNQESTDQQFNSDEKTVVQHHDEDVGEQRTITESEEVVAHHNINEQDVQNVQEAQETKENQEAQESQEEGYESDTEDIEDDDDYDEDGGDDEGDNLIDSDSKEEEEEEEEEKKKRHID
eukprot:TRINITY_DN2487_c0_g2_i2.p1 TRINITY_DN2487_c0_g2~~TRINITY_DN2487_c0_g2_i2.p1  ORF type:complete len:705 (-),score=260.25 TRINITY_DN2487_c0_g2_i2:1605-3719(-)